MSTYRHPYADDAYSTEPSDTDANTLVRALAHWCSAYPERNVVEIVEDIIASNGASENPITRDEVVAIAGVFGITV
jgi:hypothetical protein